VNGEQSCTVSYYVLMQMNIFETAVERGMKVKSSDCVKGQQRSMPVDAALSSPERHVSEQTPPLCNFKVCCLILGWGLRQSMRQGLLVNR